MKVKLKCGDYILVNSEIEFEAVKQLLKGCGIPFIDTADPTYRSGAGHATVAISIDRGLDIRYGRVFRIQDVKVDRVVPVSFSMQLVALIPDEETVEFNGKQYIKRELEAVLAKLTAVEVE